MIIHSFLCYRSSIRKWCLAVQFLYITRNNAPPPPPPRETEDRENWYSRGIRGSAKLVRSSTSALPEYWWGSCISNSPVRVVSSSQNTSTILKLGFVFFFFFFFFFGGGGGGTRCCKGKTQAFPAVSDASSFTTISGHVHFSSSSIESETCRPATHTDFISIYRFFCA